MTPLRRRTYCADWPHRQRTSGGAYFPSISSNHLPRPKDAMSCTNARNLPSISEMLRGSPCSSSWRSRSSMYGIMRCKSSAVEFISGLLCVLRGSLGEPTSHSTLGGPSLSKLTDNFCVHPSVTEPLTPMHIQSTMSMHLGWLPALMRRACCCPSCFPPSALPPENRFRGPMVPHRRQS